MRLSIATLGMCLAHFSITVYLCSYYSNGLQTFVVTNQHLCALLCGTYAMPRHLLIERTAAVFNIDEIIVYNGVEILIKWPRTIVVIETDTITPV